MDSEKDDVEIMPGVQTTRRNLVWFISKMFDPEGNIWIWLRRISNILIFPIFIMLLILVFK